MPLHSQQLSRGFNYKIMIIRRSWKLSGEAKKNVLKNGMKTRFKKGHYVLQEIRDKISKAHLGKKHSEETKKKISEVHKGKKKCKKHKENLSKAMKGKYSMSKHPNWKGGITPLRVKIWHSKEYKEWREVVFTRDNYACWICEDSKGGNFQAHHLKKFADYPKLRFVVSNGLTLCEFCHKTYTRWGASKQSSLKLNGK